LYYCGNEENLFFKGIYAITTHAITIQAQNSVGSLSVTWPRQKTFAQH